MDTIKYLADLGLPFTVEERPLWWHTHGLQQTASGYGAKLTTSRVIRFGQDRKYYRVYVTRWSNAGSAWIQFRGRRYYVRDCDV